MTEAALTFSIDSSGYAEARPHYPRSFFDWIFEQCDHRNRAWDCATGNGQAAIALAEEFAWVDASDISREQIERGSPHARISYQYGSAEHSGYPNASFDFVGVAQALHWFKFAEFWPELLRVTRPDAFFCAWGYSWFTCDSEIDAHLVQPLREMILPYWASNNRFLWRGYQTHEIGLPFSRVDAPPFEIRLKWTMTSLVRYMQTWSAFKRAKENKRVARKIELLLDESLTRFDPIRMTDIVMPLQIVAGYPHK